MVQIEYRDSKKSAEKVVGHFDEDFVFEPESSGKLLTCFKWVIDKIRFAFVKDPSDRNGENWMKWGKNEVEEAVWCL